MNIGQSICALHTLNASRYTRSWIMRLAPCHILFQNNTNSFLPFQIVKLKLCIDVSSCYVACKTQIFKSQYILPLSAKTAPGVRIKLHAGVACPRAFQRSRDDVTL